MTAALSWHITRTTGLLAWILLAVATIWGLLLTSRLLERRPSPAWLLDLHRHLGNLTLLLTVVHVVAIYADDFVDYTATEVLVPFVSDEETGAVALGIGAFWALLLVQASSWLRRRIDQRLWRALHLLSAPLVVVVVVHGWMVGTDADNPVVVIVTLVLLAELLLIAILRVRFGRRPLIPADLEVRPRRDRSQAERGRRRPADAGRDAPGATARRAARY